jgi:hypothetical protein
MDDRTRMDEKRTLYLGEKGQEETDLVLEIKSNGLLYYLFMAVVGIIVIFGIFVMLFFLGFFGFLFLLLVPLFFVLVLLFLIARYFFGRS